MGNTLIYIVEETHEITVFGSVCNIPKSDY